MTRVYQYFVLCLIAIAILIPVLVFSISKARGSVLTFQARPENDLSYLSRYYQIQYRSIEEIYHYMIDLVKSYSFFCELNQIGHTSQKGLLKGFPIYLLKISSGFPKPIILIIGGINANDWKSVTSSLYVANQLLANCSKAGQLITTYDWHFIPILNPDGYNYSRTTPAAAQWIKNIARWSMDYVGVNLDYNFGYHWVRQYNFNEDTFGGINRFSEDESKILRDYIRRVQDYTEMVIILKSHTSATPKKPAITFPWSYTNRKVPHWVLLEYLGVMGSQAAKKATGTKYKVIQSGRQVKNQSGRIDDWLFSVGIKRVLTIQAEFRADMVADPYESIIKMGTEVFAIIKEVCITAFHQPLSYRKTHERIEARLKIHIGTVVMPNDTMYGSQTAALQVNQEEKKTPR